MASFDYRMLVESVRCKHRDGYLWNGFGLFFRRGIIDEVEFPPAQKSLALRKELEYSVWDAFHEKYTQETNRDADKENR